MKKIALLAVGFLMAGSSAFAQTTTTTTTTGPSWGLKVGVNLPKYSFHAEDAENPETKTTTNFHVRAFVDLPVGAMFSIQPGIGLEGKGGEVGQIGDAEIKDNTMWIEVPVNLVGKIPLGATGSNIFLGAGPYAALGVSGERVTDTNNGTDTSQKIKFGDEQGGSLATGNLKSLDLGVNFMGGVRLGSGWLVGAQYGLGLNDLRPNGEGGEGKLTQRVWSFSLGYSF
ncbi:outer membrane beta-barrel protein [Pedobacter sp. SYSU D00535]|uniref:outer membrane beta-barrel protein n=1 Tax=Pedobacter sp. SYSU D00535 TaxID=2810308 RepID=UPI001A9631BF|nr:outer membrane beta-barrel protein [Pedobacter sp. SYSU D00535]